MRSLMHIEEEPNPMSCAVTVITQLIPKGLSGDGIDLVTPGSAWEDGRTALYHPFKHKGIIQPLFRRSITQGYHPRDIRGAGTVLATRIDQQQPVGMQFTTAGFRRLVMGQCAVGTVTRNGIEAFTHETIPISAKLV